MNGNNPVIVNDYNGKYLNVSKNKIDYINKI